MLRGGGVSPAGRHGHKVRELKRRIDAVLEEDRERRRPLPPPVSEEHAAMRGRIERGCAELEGQIPEGMDLAEAVADNPDLAAPAAELVVLMRKEQDFLVAQGVDLRPYDRYEPNY
jgi:hypothetical protein